MAMNYKSVFASSFLFIFCSSSLGYGSFLFFQESTSSRTELRASEDENTEENDQKPMREPSSLEDPAFPIAKADDDRNALASVTKKSGLAPLKKLELLQSQEIKEVLAFTENSRQEILNQGPNTNLELMLESLPSSKEASLLYFFLKARAGIFEQPKVSGGFGNISAQIIAMTDSSNIKAREISLSALKQAALQPDVDFLKFLEQNQEEVVGNLRAESIIEFIKIVAPEPSRERKDLLESMADLEREKITCVAENGCEPMITCFDEFANSSNPDTEFKCE